ncbi:MAG: pyridoxamine 5'-phosphate oxidase family protein [Nitratireductor sp.]
MKNTSFHDGERHIQVLTGEDRIANRNSRFIRETLVAGSERMLGMATSLNISVSDVEANVWSFVAIGAPGLIRRLDDKTAFLDRKVMTAPDALWPLLEPGAGIGLVAMDLTSARRFRINGKIGEVTGDGISVHVSQTCPNCPKYIQQRLPVREHAYADVTFAQGTALDQAATDLIKRSDTFFVASRSADGDHDASHRGGMPGFVTIEGNTLTVPDYFGNSMFMTLGNFCQNPAAGLTFVDFESGAQLNLTGRVSIAFDDATAHDGSGGRFWTFDVTNWRYVPFRPTPAWHLQAYSQFNPTALSVK